VKKLRSNQLNRNSLQEFRNREQGLSSIMFGKIPPQARELEEAVLGALMVKSGCANPVIAILPNKECFYLDAHKEIYQAILKLHEERNPVDILTVTEELRKNGHLESVGGPLYITELTNRVASDANVEFHARIILQEFIKRTLIKYGSWLVQQAYEDSTDCLELFDESTKELNQISKMIFQKTSKNVGFIIRKVLKRLETIANRDEELTGIPSGFKQLDELTLGWQRADLIVIAARPGMGKTALALALARNPAIDYNIPIAIFSIEMSDEQLVTRMISSEAKINNYKLRKGDLTLEDWTQLMQEIGKLIDANIWIDDQPSLNIIQLSAKSRQLVEDEDIQMIIVDYLQIMEGLEPGEIREQTISAIARGLKSLAKELDIPIIALGQLSRAVETRGGSKIPKLSDLRESGSIEQEADIVIFIYRPDYYAQVEGKDKSEDENGNDLTGLAQLIIAKHRNGALGKVVIRYVEDQTKFIDLDDSEHKPLPF